MPVALVTGAGRAIGGAVAVHLARAGFDVAITTRALDDDPLPVGAVEAEGVRCLPLVVDLTERRSVVAAAERVLSEWGGVDVLVHNARYMGEGHWSPFLDAPIEVLERQIEANVMAPIVLTKLVLPGMLARGHGCIVSMTSVAATSDPKRAGGWSAGYGMTKAALHRLAPILALELGDRGIRAHNVDPGNVGDSAELADAVGARVAALAVATEED
jgi:NAD(P)-dependent dehydrogenase (short-subunit alcohol dehydrogenase family)